MGARASSCIRAESEPEAAGASSGGQVATIRSPRTLNDEQNCAMLKFAGARINSFLLDEETGVLQPVASCTRSTGARIFRSCIAAEDSTPRVVEVKQPAVEDSHRHEVEAQPAAASLNAESSNSVPTSFEKRPWATGLSRVSRKPARPSDSSDDQSNLRSDAADKSVSEKAVPSLDLSAVPRKEKQNSQKVSLQMTLHGLCYKKITRTDHAQVHASFIDSIKEGLLHQAGKHGKNLTKDDIDISLSEGSIKVLAQFYPPAGHDILGLHNQLTGSDTIHHHVLERVKKCHPDIHHVLQDGQTLDTLDMHNCEADHFGYAQFGNASKPSRDAPIAEEVSTARSKDQIYLGNGDSDQVIKEHVMEAALLERELTEQEQVVAGDCTRSEDCMPCQDEPETKASSGHTTFQSIHDESQETVTEQQAQQGICHEAVILPADDQQQADAPDLQACPSTEPSHEKPELADIGQDSPAPDIGQDSPAPIEDRIWIVVGGGDVGGIKVRRSEDRASKELARLETGSRIKQLEINGERLSYQLIEGHGPEFGWVSIRMKGKALVELE